MPYVKRSRTNSRNGEDVSVPVKADGAKTYIVEKNGSVSKAGSR